MLHACSLQLRQDPIPCCMHASRRYDGPDPTPNGGCLAACNASGCLTPPMVQVYDVVDDIAERNDLSQSNATLVAELLSVVDKFNRSTYIDALFFHHPIETDCPFNDADGILTPCSIPSGVSLSV